MELKPNPGSDRAWTWTAEDWADGDKQVASFAIKFKNTDGMLSREFGRQVYRWWHLNADNVASSLLLHLPSVCSVGFPIALMLLLFSLVANEFKSQYDSARKTNERLFAGGAIGAPESKTASPAGAGSPWDEILAKK
mgnify:CR=1 FL=1